MNHKAMSLVEIIVGMIILAVAALLVSSTFMLVKSRQMRTPSASATGGSLDIQATNYARETFEALKNVVSTQVATGQTGEKLVDSSYGASCGGSIAAGEPCGAGTLYPATDPINVLPAGDFASSGGSRTYTVQDISDGNGNVAYKKVTACVAWTSDATSSTCP